MNGTEAQSELRTIRDMIEKTRESTTRAWNYLFFWGILIIAAIAGMYVLEALKAYDWIWANWSVFVIIGIAYSLFYVARKERSQGVRTYAQVAVAHLTTACSVAFITMGLVFPLLKVYDYGAIPVLLSVIVGILFFVLGGVYDWGLLRWCAALWWIGAFVMILVSPDWRALVFIPLIVMGYFVPGFILRARSRKA